MENIRIGIDKKDILEQGNYYDLGVWKETDIDKVLRRAEHVLKKCEKVQNSCKNRIHHITVFSAKEENERKLHVSENGCFFITTFVGSSIYSLDKRGLYYIWRERNKKLKTNISCYYQVITPNNRRRAKVLVLKGSRDVRSRKYVDILDQFDYVLCTDFGREFVFTT